MIVVNIRVEPFDVYGGRAGNGYDGWLGNPFRLRREEDRLKILELHRRWFHGRLVRDPEFRRRVLALRGKRVGCHCRPKPCHLDIVAEWVNSQPEERSGVSG